MDISIESILSDLGIDYRLDGNIKKTFRNVATIQQGKEDDLCYCSFDGEEAVSIISKSNAGIILCKNSLKEFLDQYYQVPKNNTQLRHQIILVDNPRAAFIKIINKIYPKQVKTRTSSTALISESATIGSNCYIGNYTVVGKDCEIGNNTVIYDRAVMVQKCKIGNNCIIEPGVTIGADGFAYERDPETMELERFPHIGGVTIGNNVEICANSSVARGSVRYCYR
jgi:UDP-3-O-[3-hydroxymyristoyl] glucosamine N-acyltransferase